MRILIVDDDRAVVETLGVLIDALGAVDIRLVRKPIGTTDAVAELITTR